MKFLKLTGLINILIIVIFSNCSTDMIILFNENGWIVIEDNDFDDGAPHGWYGSTGTDSSVNIPAQCESALSKKMLGPFANPAPEPNKETMKVFDISAYPHKEVWITFDLWIMESWDGESAFVEIDDIVKFSSSYNFRNIPLPNTPYINICSTCEDGLTYPDFGPQRIEIRIPHTSDRLTVRIYSTLDQLGPSNTPTDEWFGVDNTYFRIR